MPKENLFKEVKNSENIYVTRNTAIDELKDTVRYDYNHEHLEWTKDSRPITSHKIDF